MLSSTAHVATGSAALYLRQLCEHFADHTQRHSAQEFEVRFDDHQGFINFVPIVSGTCQLDARQEGVLVVKASGTNEAALARVQRIVTKHLERFGSSGRLTVDWSPASEQSSES